MNNQPDRKAIVLGASVAGLLAARALSDSFEEVLLIERAELPDDAAPRPTVPQGRHSHGLLAGGIEALERLLPGLVAELGAKGCQSGDNLRDVSWIFGGKRLAVGDSGVPGGLRSRGRSSSTPFAPAFAVSAVCGFGQEVAQRGSW